VCSDLWCMCPHRARLNTGLAWWPLFPTLLVPPHVYAGAVPDLQTAVEWLMAPEVNHKRVEVLQRSSSTKARPRTPPAAPEDQEGVSMTERILQSFDACSDSAPVVCSLFHGSCFPRSRVSSLPECFITLALS
jgi:hypothetical protein